MVIKSSRGMFPVQSISRFQVRNAALELFTRMNAMMSQIKRLYWSMVLATIVLLTRFSAMDSMMICAASYATKHGGEIDARDARVKRYLRSSSESSRGMNEDRGGFVNEAAIAETIGLLGRVEAKHDMPEMFSKIDLERENVLNADAYKD